MRDWICTYCINYLISTTNDIEYQLESLLNTCVLLILGLLNIDWCIVVVGITSAIFISLLLDCSEVTSEPTIY